MVTDISVRKVGEYGAEDRSWTIGDKWTSRNVPLDYTKFTHANFADGIIKSGCLIALDATTGKGEPYKAGLTPIGHLVNTTRIPEDKTTVASDAVFSLLQVREDRLPYKSGDGSVDAAAKTALARIEYI